jgi:hypothetical protein
MFDGVVARAMCLLVGGGNVHIAAAMLLPQQDTATTLSGDKDSFIVCNAHAVETKQHGRRSVRPSMCFKVSVSTLVPIF